MNPSAFHLQKRVKNVLFLWRNWVNLVFDTDLFCTRNYGDFFFPVRNRVKNIFFIKIFFFFPVWGPKWSVYIHLFKDLISVGGTEWNISCENFIFPVWIQEEIFFFSLASPGFHSQPHTALSLLSCEEMSKIFSFIFLLCHTGKNFFFFFCAGKKHFHKECFCYFCVRNQVFRRTFFFFFLLNWVKCVFPVWTKRKTF